MQQQDSLLLLFLSIVMQLLGEFKNNIAFRNDLICRPEFTTEIEPAPNFCNNVRLLLSRCELHIFEVAQDISSKKFHRCQDLLQDAVLAPRDGTDEVLASYFILSTSEPWIFRLFFIRRLRGTLSRCSHYLWILTDMWAIYLGNSVYTKKEAIRVFVCVINVSTV